MSVKCPGAEPEMPEAKSDKQTISESQRANSAHCCAKRSGVCAWTRRRPHAFSCGYRKTNIADWELRRDQWPARLQKIGVLAFAGRIMWIEDGSTFPAYDRLRGFVLRGCGGSPTQDHRSSKERS